VSAKATFWAWRQAIKPASAKLALLCMADCHNADNGQCNPSVAYIARHTGLDRKTVLVAIADLVKMGAITVEKHHGAGNHYTLLTSTDIGTSPESGTSPKNGTAPVPKTVPAPVPKLGHEPTKESTKNLKDKNYIFEGDTIRLTENDFCKMVAQYKNLNVADELLQLDLELHGTKKWYGAMHAKLNYRNKNHANTGKPVNGHQDTRRLSGAAKTELAREAARRREQQSSDLGRVEAN